MRVREKEITLFDGGEGRFSATTLETVGRAVCRVLEREQDTENSVVRVQDTGITLRRLLEMGNRAVGEDRWTVQEARVQDVLERAWEGWRGGRGIWVLCWVLFRLRFGAWVMGVILRKRIIKCWD
jgi:hypothetical protein